MSQPRFWIAAVVVAAAVTPSPVRADRKNEIRAVTFDEDAGTTRVHVRGAQTPTFTVYKLERPSRVVIDVPQARLGEALRGHESAAVLAANTWAVSTIAAQELDDGGLVVRVIVTLARPGRYDVKTVGNDLVVMVMPRDPAPKTASPEALAAAQAEREQARQAAQAAERGRAQAEKSSAVAMAEAAKAKDTAAAAQAEVAKANDTAAAAQAEAAKTRQDAAREIEAAARTKTEAEAAKLAASREAETAKQAAAREAAAAKQELARTKTEAEVAKQAANHEAEAAKQAAKAAEAAKAETTQRRAEAEAAKAETTQRRAEAEAAKAETTQRRAEAETAKADAAQKAAELLAARQKAEVAEREAAQKRAEATAAQADAAKLLDDNARMHADASRARSEADTAKAEAARMRGEAEAARREAEAAKAQAATDKRAAEAARGDAEKLLREAKQQVASLDKKAQAAQALEDKARAANAAAQAREEAAGAIAARAAGERAAAEAAAKAAAEARDRLAHQAGADRDKAIGDARAAEARLTQARQATETAEQQRAAAEAAATAARREFEATRTALSSVEQQRTAAETAANQAARQRGEAEAAAAEAAHRRSASETAAAEAGKQRAAAELAANQATQRRSEAEAERAAAEQQRTAAEAAARTAKAAADAAAHQRLIAEAATNTAVAAKRDAEGGLAELSARRLAAERAATELETRSKAEAKAQAEVVAAKARKASEGEIAQARAEASRLAGERQHAEAELADRRKEAFAQKAEADRLKLAAAQAHDAADREEARRAALAEQRAAEEQALARIKAQKAAAELAAVQPAAATAIKPRAATPPTVVTAAAQPAVTTSTKPGVAMPPFLATAMPPAGTPAALATKPGVTMPPFLASAVPPAGTPAVPTANKLGVTMPPSLATTAPSAGKPAAPATKPGLAAPTAAASNAPVAGKPAKPTPLAQVRDIAFTGDAATGRVTIALAGDATVTLGEVTPAAAELFIDHAQLAGKLERKLDVSRFGGPVHAISSFRDRRTPDRVRLIAELSSPATPTFDRQAGVVRWSFAGADLAKRPAAARPALARTQDVPSPVVGGFGAASTPVAQQSVAQLPPQGNRRRVYHGQTVDVHLKDAPIRDLLRLIADTGKVSIVVPDTIDARVTLDLSRVPWDQALEVILSSHQLWYRREGNLYRIAPRKELDAEDEAEAARREAALKAEAPRPQLVPLNYSSAADLAKKLEPMLSPHGKIAVDERTNQLIVTDVSGNREQIARLALSLDTQTPQISIEARIVEANSTFLRQIGVQWGGRALAGATGGNATGLVWPSSVSVIGGNEDAQTVRGGVASPSDFAVNLPAATGSGEGGALGLSLGSVGGNFNINLRLSALEDAGSVRIISSPKVTVLNNKLASIASGVSIPISTISATGTQTQFVQADLRLDVTPTVSQSDCSISMNLSVSKNAPDFGQLGARGDPTIQRREARTSMLVADGETSVLGGIYTRTTSLAYKKIPFLGDLPVLGWLFKNRREQDDRTELLVFITPKITNRALLRCGK